MATEDPNNSQLKAMFQRIKFFTDVATELVTVQGIDSIQEIKTLKKIV